MLKRNFCSGFKISNVGSFRVTLTSCFSLPAHTFSPEGTGVNYVIIDLRRAVLALLSLSLLSLQICLRKNSHLLSFTG